MDIEFLKQCNSTDAYPANFVRWKNVEKKKMKGNSKVYEAHLNHVTKVGHKNLQKLQNGHCDLNR